MIQTQVTKENLNLLVVRFYTKVVKDDLIGPIFRDVLGSDLKSPTWQTHIQLITDFWASVTLGDFAYAGSPFAPHVKLQDRLSRQAFEQWLTLFLEILNTIFEPHIAKLFHERGIRIAGNFMRNLNIH